MSAESARPAEYVSWGEHVTAQPPRDTRWRRSHIHFSPAARPLPQAGSQEWSVASDAEADIGERNGPETNADQLMINTHPAEYLVSLINRAKTTRDK